MVSTFVSGAVLQAYFAMCTVALQCFPQRAALLKSMLNFLKKAIPDPAFADSIRHCKMSYSSCDTYIVNW